MTTGHSRQKDHLWDALLVAVGWVGRALTRSERGQMNLALKRLRMAGAEPDRIPARAASYRAVWPDAKLTPLALAKHWTTIEADARSAKVEPARRDEGQFRSVGALLASFRRPA